MRFEQDGAAFAVDAAAGGRLSSLYVASHELLVIEAALGSLQWGSYPMVPWAGRVREGRFEFGTITHELERNIPPHSAHGVGFVSPWDNVDNRTIGLDMRRRWPLGGRVEQRFVLDADGLTITMEVEATEDMPVMVGWHPWFRRYLQTPDGPVEAELHFGPGLMYELDDAAIPTGELVTTPPGPWDNCFVSLENDPVISWPGVLDLQLTSS